MTIGFDWGAGDASRHDWKSPLRDQAKRVAGRLGLSHHGIWAMEGSIGRVDVAVTERVGARSLKLSIVVTAPRPFGPEDLSGAHRRVWLPALRGRVRSTGRVVGSGRAAIRLTAADNEALTPWLDHPRREALEALGRVDGKLTLDRTGVTVVSTTIGRDASEVERTIQVMATAVDRLSS